MPKFLSSGFLGLALLCFFLPWVTVSCDRQPVVKLSGVQMVKGTTVATSGLTGDERRISGEKLAMVACVLIVCALAVSFANMAGSGKVSGALAIIAAALIIALKIKISKDVSKEGGGLLQLEMQFGYYLTLLSSIVASILSFIGLKNKLAEPKE